MVHDAVIRNLEIIGEAAKRIGDDYRAAHPESPGAPLPACATCSFISTRV